MPNKLVGLILVLVFALALGAGVVAGKLTSRVGAGGAVSTPSVGSLSDELHLSDSQRAQMKEIWVKVQQTSQECVEKAKAVHTEQDQQLHALLNPDQQEKWSKITLDNNSRLAEIESTRKNSFTKGVDDTAKLLDESQKKVYKQIIESHLGAQAVPQSLSENLARP